MSSNKGLQKTQPLEYAIWLIVPVAIWIFIGLLTAHWIPFGIGIVWTIGFFTIMRDRKNA